MAKKDFNQLALDQAKINGGKLSVEPKVPIETRDDLSIAYTPGVGQFLLLLPRISRSFMT